MNNWAIFLPVPTTKGECALIWNKMTTETECPIWRP